MALAMLRPAYVRLNGNVLTDHNRSPVEIDVERIEQRTRVASGRMRKIHTADKRSFSMSWEMLPETSAGTVDGHWGAAEMKNFFDTTTTEFTLSLVRSDGGLENYTVVFTDFSANPVKRWGTYYYEVSMSLEEV